MSLYSILQSALHNRLAEKPKPILRSQCEDIKSFTNRVQHILNQSKSESVVEIPFPAPCGLELKTMLEGESIRIQHKYETSELEKSTRLFIVFDTTNEKLGVVFGH
jgi:hypothetical protein